MKAAKTPTLPAPLRVLLSLLLPLLVAWLASQLAGGPQAGADPRARNALLLTSIGLVSWLLGLFWYGLPGMGLRGKRALYAGIGFAALAWLVVLTARFVLVASAGITNAGAARTFFYLLLFESFCVQLWAFGLLFRSVVDWRGPLTGVLAAGVAFGLCGWLIFGEAVVAGAAAILFFILWGFLYGLIRLRAGSLLGIVIIQALQTFTTWHILTPRVPANPTQYGQFYLVSSLLFVILIWRLWPKRKEDYRV